MRTLLLIISLTLFGAASAQTVTDLHNAYEAMYGRRWDDAVKFYKKLVDESPENPDYWGSYSQALLEAKKFSEVIPAAEKAATLGYFPWRVYYTQAKAYSGLADRDKTLSALQRALNAKWYGGEQFGSEPAFDFIRDDVRFKRMLGADFDKATISREEGWRKDIDYALREARRQHYDFDAVRGKKAIDGFCRRLRSDVPKLKDHEIVVGLQELMAMGGDGHTWALAPQSGSLLFHTFPIQLFRFKEGFYVTGAAEAYKHLNGLRLQSIEGIPIEKAIDGVKPTISGETSVTVDARLPRALTTPEVLHTKRVIKQVDQAKYEFMDKQGKTVQEVIKAVPQQPAPTFVPARNVDQSPLYLKDRIKPYWFEYQADSKVLFTQYNAVRDASETDTLRAFWPKVFKAAEDNKAEAIVIDIRWNGGGNLFLNDSLIKAIISSAKFNEVGKLYVITGRHTYSAAASLVGKLDRMTEAVFVGEPAGASPNFVGEGSVVFLPYSGIRCSISSLYWQNTHGMDRRSWVGPHINAEPTWELFIQNRDPAMEAILKSLRAA
ncbi:MAG: hypothetical protein H7Y17_16835 [Chlorobia bacterium]|nr:hypothetical protein [Fimbriimonadaceae bacterium]